MRRPDAKQVSLALLPTLACVVIAAVAGEIALRSRNASTAALSAVAAWKTAEWGGLVYGWDTYHPRFGWTNLADYRSGFETPFAVTINRHGLRALREYGASPPPGRRRLLVFGDSSVFGEEVDDDETLPAHLERELRAVEVLNFGVHGYGLGQMALRLEEEGFATDPDHVVVVFLTYDFLRDPEPEFVHAKPVFRMEAGRLAIRNTPVPESSRLPWLARHSFVAAWIWGTQHRLKPIAGRTLDARLEITSAILDRIRAVCEAQGVPLTLVHIVDGPTLDALRSNSIERARVDRIRAVLAASRIDLLDLAEILEERQRAGPSLLAPHGHWSGPGNQLIAQRIARHLDPTLGGPAAAGIARSAPIAEAE